MEPDKMPDQSPDDSDAGSDSPAMPAGLNSITDELIAASPLPNQPAIDAAEAKQAEIRAQYSDLRDVKGNRFDPELHVTDDDGAPKLTKNGKLRLRPGRKSSARTAKETGAPPLTGGPEKPSLSPAQKMQARQTGEAAASALIMMGVVVGGEEFHPITDERNGIDERRQLSTAFGDYFEAKEMTDIPPGVALTIAITAYVVPRFTMPKTKTRIQRLKEWVAVKLAKRKIRKNGAQSNTGDDGKRQDDNSEGNLSKPGR